MFRFIQFALLITAVTAFTASRPAFVVRPAVVASTTARQLIMADEETEAVLKHAGDCVEGECSLEEVDDLLSVLKSTETELEDRLEKIMNMIGHLQHINEKEERKTDEVRAFVKDMLRVFSTDKPTYFPTGFSGDIGGGPTTAYDALPPKKWTNPDKK